MGWTMKSGCDQKLIFQKKATAISFSLCLLSFFLVLLLGYSVYSSFQILEDAKKGAEDQAHKATQEINKKLLKIVFIAEDLERKLNSRDIKEQRIDDQSDAGPDGKLDGQSLQVSEMKFVEGELYNTTINNSQIFGIGVSYAPYVFGPERKLYSAYYLNYPKITLKHIEDEYDYTEPDGKGGYRTEWYHSPMTEGPTWNEPYFGTAANTFLAEYSVPFNCTFAQRQGIIPAGVIFVSYSLKDVRRLIGELDLNHTGYGFVITEKGIITSYPVQEYLGKNFNDLKNKDENIRIITLNMSGGGRFVTNNLTGQSSWIFYEKIPSTNWTMGVVLFEEDIFHEIRQEQLHLMIEFTTAILMFLFFLAVFLCCRYRYSEESLWILAILFSLFCLLEICFVCHLSLQDSFKEDLSEDSEYYDYHIYDRVGLENALYKLHISSHTSDARKEVEYFEYSEIIRVPTGVFLQSIEFLTPNDVLVTGYVWQKYPENVNKSVFSPGFIFPEAKSSDFKEVYNENNVSGWYFEAVLRQSFDYSKYPINHDKLWIRLWPKSFDSNVILIPDFDSYENLTPSTLPGLEKEFVLENWAVQNSYFSLRKKSYNTAFGLENYTHNDLSELYFNIGIKMNFMGPFISELTPLVVVSFLIFAVLLISTKKQEKMNLYGFSSSAVLAYCASLLFVLIVSHISLRGKINVNGISYLEYFYFVMYFVILIVSVNSIIFASDSRFVLIKYKDNLIVKVLYWPMITGSFLLITLGIFL